MIDSRILDVLITAFKEKLTKHSYHNEKDFN